MVQRDDTPWHYYQAKGWLYTQLGNPEVSGVYIDSAVTLLTAAALENPEDGHPHIDLATIYGWLGRKDAAIREWRRGIELNPLANDPVNGWAHVLALAATYTQFGEYDAAVEQLDRVLSIPSLVSSPLLRVDPLWAPLRSNPRFQALLAKYDKPPR